MKILVRGTNWIGDSVMTLPALRSLRSLLPKSEIVLYTRKSTAGIFTDADFIDRILPIEADGASLSAVIVEARRLRKEKFDLAIVFPNSFASALPVRLAGVRRRFGYANGARRLLLTDSIEAPTWKDSRHEVFYYLELIKTVERRVLDTSTISDSNLDGRLIIHEARKEKARQVLRESGIDLPRRIVAIGAGSTNSAAKRWPVERFVETAKRLQDDSRAQIVLLGSPGDRRISKTIADAFTARPVDLTGSTSVEDAVAILSVCDLLISNDMGLAHIADALGTKTIVIFGPTNPITTRPFSPRSEVVRHEVECSPCMLRECPIDHRCMTRIKVDQVYETAERLLKSND